MVWRMPQFPWHLILWNSGRVFGHDIPEQATIECRVLQDVLEPANIVDSRSIDYELKVVSGTNITILFLL